MNLNAVNCIFDRRMVTQMIAEGHLTGFLLGNGEKMVFELEKLPYVIKPSLLGFVNNVLTYVQNSKGEYFKVHVRVAKEGEEN